MRLISAKTLVTAFATLAFTLGASTMVSAAGDAKAELAAAKKETDTAEKMGHAWTTWKKMFQKAEAAIKDGDADKAIKIAGKIKFQGLAAQKQAEVAKNAGPTF